MFFGQFLPLDLSWLFLGNQAVEKVNILDRLIDMKTSPNTSLAVFVTLALGGAIGGSLFSASLQDNVYSSVGTASTFFTDVKTKETTQPVQVMAKDPESYWQQDTVALPIKAKSVKSAPSTEIEVRVVVSSPITESDPEPASEPIAATETAPTPDSTDEQLITPESDTANVTVLAPELTGEPLESPIKSELNADIPLIVLG